MNIKPLHDRIVLQAIQKENVTQSGIYIPEGNNKERAYVYEVLAVGPGKEGKNISLQIGDKILCGQYSGDDVKVDGKEYKIVGYDYILAKID